MKTGNTFVTLPQQNTISGMLIQDRKQKEKVMTNKKLIIYNVAEQSDTDARIARMMASRHEISASTTKNGK